MKYTLHYKMKKPEPDDVYDVNDFADVFDDLDAQQFDQDGRIADLEKELESLDGLAVNVTVNGQAPNDKGEITVTASNITGGILGTRYGGTGNNTGYIAAGQKAGTALGNKATAEGMDTTASRQYAHAEGRTTTASGEAAHAEGFNTQAIGDFSHAEGRNTIADGNSHAEGEDTKASGAGAHAEGTRTKAMESCSHAEGSQTTAQNYYSHAEGLNTRALGQASHAEGSQACATGDFSHAEGTVTITDTDKGCAFGKGSHVEGIDCTAGKNTNETGVGEAAHAEGFGTVASGIASHAGGFYTIAGDYQCAIGKYNVERAGGLGTNGDVFIIGKGTLSARANAFRVSSSGAVFGCASYASTGADYAEYFEWDDKNPGNEDRRGLFVCLNGSKIALADQDSDYILGIISANPAVLGDTYDDQWSGMYERDVFGATVWNEMSVPEYTDEDGTVHPEQRYRTEKISGGYDPAQPYLPRSQRPEWGIVGLIGKLTVIDDGTCVPNGYCTVGPGGTGAAGTRENGWRVLERLDSTHIRVFFR